MRRYLDGVKFGSVVGRDTADWYATANAPIHLRHHLPLTSNRLGAGPPTPSPETASQRRPAALATDCATFVLPVYDEKKMLPCNKDFLENTPESACTDVAVWGDSVLAESFVPGRYVGSTARLLITGQYKVFEVVYRVGFTDVKYFRQCFTWEFGYAPSECLKMSEPKKQ